MLLASFIRKGVVNMTLYSNIYERFLQKITDFDLGHMMPSEAQSVLLGFLKSAIPKFTQCKMNLINRNDTEGKFNDKLTDTEEEILSCMMVLEWTTPFVNHSNFLEAQLSSRDFNRYSPANQLDKIMTLRDETQKEVNNLIVRYTYDSSAIGDLR